MQRIRTSMHDVMHQVIMLSGHQTGTVCVPHAAHAADPP